MVEPVATTLKLVAEPAQVETACGCVVILTGLFTASIAAAELRLVVQVPFNTTRYWYPFIEAVMPVILSVAALKTPVVISVKPEPVFTCH